MFRNSPNGFCSNHSSFYGSPWGCNDYQGNTNTSMYENLASPIMSSQYSSNTSMCHPTNNYYNNNSQQFMYPQYNSLRVNKNQKYLNNHSFSESKTLGRYKHDRTIPNNFPKSLTSSFTNINLSSTNPNDDKNNFKSEHCLNWLENTENIDSLENHVKELDTNIKLLTWKKNHLENIKLQKNTISKQVDHPGSHQSDSPPPLSDFLKPDLSIMSTDDGFESVADVCNNNAVLQISDLECQLRKQELKMKMYEAMLNKSKQQVHLMKSEFKNKENEYQEEIEKLKHGFDSDTMLASSPLVFQQHNNMDRSIQNSDVNLEGSMKKLNEPQQIGNISKSGVSNKPVRPNSLSKKQLFNTNYDQQQQMKSSTPNSVPQKNFSNINHSNTNINTNKNNLNANINSTNTSNNINNDNNINNHNNINNNNNINNISNNNNNNDMNNSSEILKLKSELLIKDQHLRKMRTALRELSVRHNELLDLHTKLVKNDKSRLDTSSLSYLLSPSLSSPMLSLQSSSSMATTPGNRNVLVQDLNCIVENLQKVISHVSKAPNKFADLMSKSASTPTSQNKSLDEVTKLKMNVQNLKLDVLKRCYTSEADV